MNDRVIAPKGYLWTTIEEAVLREHYPTAGPERCVELLPHRGLAAVYAKARVLGLRAPKLISSTAGKRFATKYPQDDRVDSMIRESYGRGIRQRGQIKALALAVNRPKWWVINRAVAMGCTVERVRPLPWSHAEDALLEQYAVCTLRVIATKLREAGFARTPTAIAVRMKRKRIDRTDPDSWSAGDLGRLLGVNGNTVCDWIERRGLTAKKVPFGHTGRYVITRGALRAWLRQGHGFVDLRKVDQPWFWGLVLGGDQAC